MGKVTKRDSDSLNQLVLDCSLYNFSEEDSLQYIKSRFGKPISGRTYRRYKRNLQNGNISQEWIKHFTRTGFVTTQHQVFYGAEYLLQSSMRRLYEEERPKKPRHEHFIIKLKQEIREELKLVSELSLGTPIISHMNTQNDKVINKYDKLVETIRMRNPELLREIDIYRYNSRAK